MLHGTRGGPAQSEDLSVGTWFSRSKFATERRVLGLFLDNASIKRIHFRPRPLPRHPRAEISAGALASRGAATVLLDANEQQQCSVLAQRLENSPLFPNSIVS